MNKKLIVLAGNPNVGKSTVFNELTGMSRHTGNWIGKTVDTSEAGFKYMFNDYTVVDLPGTYSLNPASAEEEIARDYIVEKNADCTVCVIDSTVLERSLLLAFQLMQITNKIIILLNLCDEAKKKGIFIDEKELSKQIGVPVVKATARSGKGINKLLEKIDLIIKNEISPAPVISESRELMYIKAKAIAELVTTKKLRQKESLLDKILLGKFTSLISMAVLLCIMLWLTISASNYPSALLHNLFEDFEKWLAVSMTHIGIPSVITNLTVNGIIKVMLWVVSVMLPPMAIFFPLFALMEDFGILPRIAFNLDGCFEKCGACGKQALTCCMGLGCNAVGVTGARIIDSPRERILAIVTNSLIPCNGRFPLLIVIISMFFSDNSVTGAVILLGFLILSLAMTFLSSKVLTSTILKGEKSSFVMELPPYRTPQVFKTVFRSIKEKVLLVLLRAVSTATPAGLIIWILSNIDINNVSILNHISNALDPLGSFIGLDGVMLLAFILGFPANEIVIPIALMAYLSSGVLVDYSSGSELREILAANGWTVKTAICTCVFSMFHFPCSTTLLTIFRETKSLKWTVVSVLTPLITGIILCALINVLM